MGWFPPREHLEVLGKASKPCIGLLLRLCSLLCALVARPTGTLALSSGEHYMGGVSVLVAVRVGCQAHCNVSTVHVFWVVNFMGLTA